MALNPVAAIIEQIVDNSCMIAMTTFAVQTTVHIQAHYAGTGSAWPTQQASACPVLQLPHSRLAALC